MRRSVLRLLLDAEPGRLRSALIMVVGVAVILVAWQTFRIPETATACYVVLFISRTERTSTVQTATALGGAGIAAVLVVVVVDAASLSQPALRIGLMAFLSVGALFLYRAARLGPLFFGAGFVTVYGLTLSDSVNRLALAPSTVSDLGGSDAGLPFILFGPPEEALTRGLLWLTAVVALPVCVVVVLNRLFGTDPADLLRQGIEERLRTVEGWGNGEAGASARLDTLARQGSTRLASLAGLANKEHGEREPKSRGEARIHATTRLMLACLAAERLSPAERPGWAGTIAAACRAARHGFPAQVRRTIADPVGAEAERAISELAGTEGVAPAGEAPTSGRAGFWAKDGFSATNVQFAVKVTLAVMTCYVLNNALDWPGIGTDVVTCFFVSLGTLGESGHKMVLRLTGCLLGGALGIAAVVVLMPLMTDIGHLLLLVAPITFVAAWIACGSERVSYAGWQLALAFFLTVLDGFGPTTDLAAARDRAVGILIGNVVAYAILSSLWPVRVGGKAASKLADALAALVRLLRAPDGAGASRDQDLARDAFARSITAANLLLRDGLFEGEQLGLLPVDELMSLRLQSLVIPASMLAAIAAPDPARHALADWLRSTEGRLRADRIGRDGFPPAPELGDGPALRARLLLRQAFADLCLPGSARSR